MHQLLINKKLYQSPSTWNELSRNQLLRICRSFLTAHPAKIKEQCLYILLGVKSWLFRAFTDAQKVNLADITDFLFETNTLTDNLLPCVRLPFFKVRRWLTLYGPAGNFDNLVMGEYIFADTIFMRWHESKKDEFLDLLFAVLYRPQCVNYYPLSPTYKGDRRENFNPNLLDYRAAQWAKHVPAPVKLAVLYWYMGCRNALANQYPEAFSGTGEPGLPTAAPLQDMLHDLPNDKFGTLEQAETALVHTVFYEVNKNNKRAKAQQPQTL